MNDYKEENVLDSCVIIIEQKVIFDPICAWGKAITDRMHMASDGKVTYVSSATSTKLCDVGHRVSYFLPKATQQKLLRWPSMDVSAPFLLVVYYETLLLTITSSGKTES